MAGRPIGLIGVLSWVFLVSSFAAPAPAGAVDAGEIAARLAAAYPDFVARPVGNMLEFKDGTSMKIDDGLGEKPFTSWLAQPDLKDMFRFQYPAGATPSPPAVDFDPGRARNEEFFIKIYGDCRQPGFEKTLASVAWLPKKTHQRILISSKNGVADHLRRVSDELDSLPGSLDVFLIPSAGGFVCRAVAGTTQRSGHAFGIAVDIATKRSDYWRWAKGGPSNRPDYRNSIPKQIVEIFEKHGFIWGGRWYHYDTMHFEYRPELIRAEK
ncbi:M15 family metallopeptidase [Hyphomicrobium sp.]|uniref:M15 family metallopeptidase n=1 Tax=Hyphomicrobium sp. TaxID=82 RepID=UPI000FC19EB8|nr:M15 family metallopeptidase [Hyphomicrobium sp.]RUO98244.1 MAG: M15 family peptidase [Hyphomicrobium sp.]